jgi:positive regulator of sigma E activity
LEISLRAAKVLQVDKNKIKVELFSNELPSACKVKGCNICASNSAAVQRYYPKSDFYGEVAINDTVKIESVQINDGLAAAIIFLIPILFSAIFYCVSIAAGVSSQSVLSVAFAVFGGFVGFAAAAVFDKIFRKLYPTKIFKE